MTTNQPRGWAQIGRLLLVLPIAALGAVLGYLVYAGFTYGWPDWTGFGSYVPSQPPIDGYQREKTLWDWLQLLVIPAVLAAGGFVFSRTERMNAEKAAQQRDETERKIAEQRGLDDILETYFDRMTELLIDKQLLASQPNDGVRDIARIRTLTALRRLDAGRNKILTQFLRDAGLFGEPNNPEPIVDLSRADLRQADLQGAVLRRANLQGANLEGANLQAAILKGANLEGANLQKAMLKEANLEEANLQEAILGSNNLVLYSTIRWSSLEMIFLSLRNPHQFKMHGADLSQGNLRKANLKGANLREVNLSRADLEGANLRDADLEGADLSFAFLGNTDLQGTKTQRKAPRSGVLKG